MKKTFIFIPAYVLLLIAKLATNSNIENTRYVQTVVPIYAICNYDNHKKIYGTVSFSGNVVSTSGRVVYSGSTPLYIYSYIDVNGNYYEPYFTGYTYEDEDYAYVSGCPL